MERPPFPTAPAAISASAPAAAHPAPLLYRVLTQADDDGGSEELRQGHVLHFVTRGQGPGAWAGPQSAMRRVVHHRPVSQLLPHRRSSTLTLTTTTPQVQHDLLPADTARRADHDGPLMTAHGRRTGRPAASCSLCVFLPNSLSVWHLVVRWCARQRGCREVAPWAVCTRCVALLVAVSK